MGDQQIRDFCLLVRRTAGKGHEDAFTPPRLSARFGFSQGTFEGTRGNGREAPKGVVSALLDWSPKRRSQATN